MIYTMLFTQHIEMVVKEMLWHSVVTTIEGVI